MTDSEFQNHKTIVTLGRN